MPTLWAMPGWRRFWLGALAARTSNEMLPLALPLLAIQERGSAAEGAAIAAAVLAPSILAGPLVARWLDASSRPGRLVALDQIVAIAVLVVVLAGVDRLPLGVLVAAGALAGITFPLSAGGLTSLLPRLATGERLASANMAEAAGLNLAAVLGPALVLVCFVTGDARVAIAAQAVLKVVALGCLWDVAGRAASAATRARGVLAGLREVAANRALAAITVAGILAVAGRGTLIGAIPAFGAASLGAAYAGTVVCGVLALGIVAGALLRPARATVRAVLAGTAISGALLAVLIVARDPVVVCLAALAAGAAYGPALVATLGVRQAAHPDLQAQLAMTATSAKTAALAAGVILGAALVPAIGVAAAMAVAAGLHVAGAAAGATLAASGGADPKVRLFRRRRTGALRAADERRLHDLG